MNIGGKEILRVFPRRTKATPDDPLAVTGAPTRKILIYSKCGTIPPTEMPNTGALNTAIGDRDKAYFECRVDGETLVLLRELRHQRW